MALLLAHRSNMLRSLVQSAGRLPVMVQQQRPMRQSTAPRAAVGEVAAGAKAKANVVGKAVLAKRLAESHQGLTQKQAADIVDTLLDDIMLTVAEGETVTIPGFGTFKKRTRSARKGRNPTTGAPLDIPAKDAPAFSAGTVFKGVVQTGSWEAYDTMVAQQKAEKAAKGKK
jgi:DNA-binding protein HU-beta